MSIPITCLGCGHEDYGEPPEDCPFCAAVMVNYSEVTERRKIMDDYNKRERTKRAHKADVLISMRLNQIAQISAFMACAARAENGNYGHVGSLESVASDLLDIVNRFPGIPFDLVPDSVCDTMTETEAIEQAARRG